jgi:hypothetical protein
MVYLILLSATLGAGLLRWGEDRVVHGSIVFSRDSSIFQAVGIPSPPGFIPVIPKYTPCRGGLWRRPGGSYCRVLRSYGPRGVSEALERSGFRERFDALYNSAIPYVAEDDVLLVIEPREALEALAASGRFHEYVGIIERIGRASSISVKELGVTGSVAAGIPVPGTSDIDLVVYGAENAVKMLNYYLGSQPTSGASITRTSHGGLESTPIDLAWRRMTVESVHVSWVGVGLGREGCKPLRSYWSMDPPNTYPVKLDLRIDPFQETALIYPPCARSREGPYLVSFEYNVGLLLYMGGRVVV